MEYLNAANSIISMSNAVLVTDSHLQDLHTLVITTMKAAFFVASGCYGIQQSGETQILEDCYRKLAWKITETSVSEEPLLLR